MAHDFTLIKYRDLLQGIINTDYNAVTVKEFIMSSPDTCIIMRHDVDRKPDRALKMAQIEHEYGVKSTYFFRMTKEVFKPKIIEKIAALGHEIGYHYEVLDKAKGDTNKAILIFKQELSELRKIADVTTICMHGNPLTSWINRDIWIHHNFKDFGIIGEVYLSIDYYKVSYFTDTGRAWNSSRHSIKDIVRTTRNYEIKSTDDLIDLIKDENQKAICIVTHPNRWTDNFSSWLTELLWQNTKNIGKSMIKFRRK